MKKNHILELAGYEVVVQSCEMRDDDIHANIGLADHITGITYRKVIITRDGAVSYPYLTARRRLSIAHDIFDAFLKEHRQEIIVFISYLCEEVKP